MREFKSSPSSRPSRRCFPGGPSGSHKIEGIGIGFIPPLWQPELVNEILAVSTDDAKAMARRLAREEGIFAGASTGANVVAAIRVAATARTGRDRRDARGRFGNPLFEHRRLSISAGRPRPRASSRRSEAEPRASS